MNKQSNLEWLQQRVEQYQSKKNDIYETIDDFDEIEKVGQGFSLVHPLEEVDIGDGTIPWPTSVNKNMHDVQKGEMIALLKQYIDCFTRSIRRCRDLAVSL